MDHTIPNKNMQRWQRKKKEKNLKSIFLKKVSYYVCIDFLYLKKEKEKRSYF